MSSGSRLTVAKTARYSVFQQHGAASLASQHTPKKQTPKILVGVNYDKEGSSTPPPPPPPPPPPRFPPTERVYMLDTYLMVYEAKVLGVVEDETQGPAVILDKTIFHPQGGGQPSDEGNIVCGPSAMKVHKVRDVGGGVIHHYYGAISGSSFRPPETGQPASLALDSAKRLRHAALHSAGHAVDRAVVEAVGTGVFSPLKGYHFDDSPYVEYRGKLPEGLDKEAFIERLNGELDKVVTADVVTVTKIVDQVKSKAHDNGAAPSPEERAGEGGRGGGGGGGGGVDKYGAATRIVEVAGLSCPCGGTHVGSTRELEGVRATKVKAKKGALRVSYSLVSPRSS
ncbi:unnamed protein product [Pylaiella littoralis]